VTYAYLRDDDTVELYASESDRPAPAGFLACTFDGFMAAWALRDSLRIARLKAAYSEPDERNYHGSRG
jgi:hypothetical protein